MCLVANGQDGSALQLENFWQIFSSLCSCVSDKIGKTDLASLQIITWHCILTAGGDYAGIHIKCTPFYMQLALETKHYERIDPASLHLTNPRCKASFYNDTLMVIRAPLGGCGTESAQQGNLLAFRNEVYADVKGRSAIAREPAYQFRLRCLYYTTAKITLHSFKPETKVIVEPGPGESLVIVTELTDVMKH